ncbi:hypothetical protein AHFPHNDE_03928 [Pseudomonas sp. MM227]|uniref:Lipoprotein n=1 Tax=Pseudomonas baltica TaxID=2762576 RepID=A0A7X1G6R6_9PSED|nr:MULTISPECIES: hypothetical protein [Pseudomonas]MBC2679538.1 hypothetical protein [Pseudomonas baltica]MBD8594179.1 hypothetical protein [Pseudomonas sp. CFBP 8758]MBD8604198.1 hypothetical protein [Pseudomonas sp. CFBP 8771]MBD8624672.1 hypothetical protein [Pseudomonas sp. CFBP 13727]MBD8733113.1 hypothetical protein [Pseudomonas sp. CFBP 13710]
MKIGSATFGLATLLAAALSSGCMSSGAGSACEVFSPVSVVTPTTQDDQRVQTNATGAPAGARNTAQDCGA